MSMANELEVVAFHYQTRQVIDYLSTDSPAEAIKIAEEMLKREPRNEIRIRPKSPRIVTYAVDRNNDGR
jgi:hypothetical protein